MTTRTNNARQREIRRSNRILIRHERLIERDVDRALRALAARLAKRYSISAQTLIEEEIDQYEADLTRILSRRLLAIALLFGQRVIDKPKSFGIILETKGAFDIFRSATLDWLANYSLERARTIAQSARNIVRDVLVVAQAEGSGERETAKRLKEAVGGQVSRTSAARIARTEAHTAAERGSLTAAEAVSPEVDMVKEWAATEDSRTRPHHNAADGQIRELDQPFSVGLASLMYPGDPSGPPKEIINCRCVALYQPRVGGRIVR